MKTTKALLVVWLLCACGEDGPGPAEDASQPPANVLLVSIDTLRPDHLGCYGYARPVSPAMDQLATDGVVFEDVTATSPWTLPSHASLLTGLYPSRHGVKDYVHRLSDTLPGLAPTLKDAGYQTFAVVNSHNVSAEFGFDRGFDSFEYVNEWGEDPSARRIVNGGKQIVALAQQWLQARDEGKPFFGFLHFYDVHTDLTPDPRFREQFCDPYDGPLDGSTGQLVQVRGANQRLAPREEKHLRDLYDAEIRTLDEVLNGFFRFLDESGLAESTVVMVTSDHGEEFQEHGSLLHGRTYFQEVIAVPLFLRGPGVPAGRRIQEPVSLVDVAPTVLGLARVTDAPDMDGSDLGVLWQDPEAGDWERMLYAEADHNNARPDQYRMLRQRRFKLCLEPQTSATLLFDLADDAGEVTNLSATRPRLREALQKDLEAFMAAEVAGATGAAPTGETLELLRALGYVD